MYRYRYLVPVGLLVPVPVPLHVGDVATAIYFVISRAVIQGRGVIDEPLGLLVASKLDNSIRNE
jgi:hypothetical protein